MHGAGLCGGIHAMRRNKNSFALQKNRTDSGVLQNNEHKSALEIINQTLLKISEEQDAIADKIATSLMSQEEYLTHIGHKQKLHDYKNHAREYKALRENGLDVTKSADNLKKMFEGLLTRGAGMEITNTLKPSEKYKLN